MRPSPVLKDNSHDIVEHLGTQATSLRTRQVPRDSSGISLVQRIKSLHVIFIESEIVHIGIRANASGRGRLWQGNEAVVVAYHVSR